MTNYAIGRSAVRKYEMQKYAIRKVGRNEVRLRILKGQAASDIVDVDT